MITFEELLDNAKKLHKEKNHDYGDAFKLGCDKYGIVSGVSRMDEKMSRINSLYNKPDSAKVNESLIDTIIDLGCYSFMLAEYLINNKNE